MRSLVIAAIGLLAKSSNVVSAAMLYPGAVPCPSNSSIIGYTNLSSLNTDIFAHYSSTDDVNVTSTKYHYILCPHTTFSVGNGEAIVPATDDSAFSCGHSHNPAHGCVLEGGSFQVYFLDFLALQNIFFRGITFKGSDVASVYGDAHPTSLVYFVDCVFENHIGISTIYLFFTPYEPGSRRLNDEKDDSFGKRPVIVDKYEAITKNKELSRELQVDIRYSMGILFRGCSFTDNKADDSIILNVGGEVALINSKFENNEATKLAIFSTLNNGHAYLASGTSFNGNKARLGPIFIDKVSFLQYSQDSDGVDNIGNDCSAILIEGEGSNCAVPALDAICDGDCCDFGDLTCDLHTEQPTPSPTISPFADTMSPTAGTIKHPKPHGSIPTKPGRSDNFGDDNGVQLDGLIETTKDVPKSNGCTGYCMGFSVVLSFYVVMVALLVVWGIKRRRDKKANSLGISVQVNDGLDDKTFT